MLRDRSRSAASAASFALRFRLLMGYHDLTLRDIAEATHCAVSTVGTWKNGRVPSSPRVRQRLADIFHVSLAYLLEGRLEEARADSPAAAAGRILEDLDLLLRALREHDGEGLWDGKRPPPSPAGNGRNSPVRPPRGRPSRIASRRKVEQYLHDYLDRAERTPGGLAYTWVQLRKEFPLDLIERLS
jgi:transcriptional regulator with XRE-family HTH domain